MNRTAELLWQEAKARDAKDPAPALDQFEIPNAEAVAADFTGFTKVSYLAGNSLGLLPSAARIAINDVVESWATRGVAGHFSGEHPWSEVVASLCTHMSEIVGARPDEVVVMNTLSVNLHLLLAAFYRPEGMRTKILIEGGSFPSDQYVVASHARLHGLDPAEAIVRLGATDQQQIGLVSTAEVLRTIEHLGPELAVVLLPGVQFRTGQVFDIEAITKAAHRVGALVVWDLAHAAGNTELQLHDWNVDAAAWCTYKYLNGGPGAVGAAFIHQRHVGRTDLSRLNGWWGNAPATRFNMFDEIDADSSALGWQVSTPPALSIAPLRPSLAMFSEAGGMRPLRERSQRLTGYLTGLLQRLSDTDVLQILTDDASLRLGAQISVIVDNAPTVTEQLIGRFGVVPDERPPNIVRFAPVPLYSTYVDCFRAYEALRQVLPVRARP